MSRRRLAALALSAALAVSLAGCASASEPETALSGVGRLPAPASAWPSAQFDARHSSDTTAVGPQTSKVRWKAAIGGDLTPGPVIGVDGSIVVASHDGSLRALDPATGHERWRVTTGRSYGGDLSTSPSVLADGTILWPGPDDTLYAVSAGGERLWTERFRGEVLSPAVGGENRVYAADMTGHVVALRITSKSHQKLWSLDVGGPDYASPSIGPDGTVYTASSNRLVAITDLGSQAKIRWTFRAKRLIEVSSGISPSGIVVVGTNGDRQYGVRPDGTVAWSFSLGDWTYSSSTVRSSGLASFADNSGRVRTVDSETGRVVRTLAPAAPAREHAWTSVVVDARGDQFWATTTGRVYGYDADGKRLFILPVDSAVDGYPALGADGTLYVGTTRGTLYAIGG